MTDLHVCAIPLDRLALCLDCEVGFHLTRGACPKCGSESGWMLAKFGKESQNERPVRVNEPAPTETKGVKG